MTTYLKQRNLGIDRIVLLEIWAIIREKGFMNAFSFINSRDIAAYLKKIHYSFSSLETSWSIYQSSNHTLQEKITAWQEVIATMPPRELRQLINGYVRDYNTIRSHKSLDYKVPNEVYYGAFVNIA